VILGSGGTESVEALALSGAYLACVHWSRLPSHDGASPAPPTNSCILPTMTQRTNATRPPTTVISA
jgi:hypothetical protein